MCLCVFRTFPRFSPVPVRLFSRSRLRGTQWAHLYTTAQVWVPGGLRRACSGRSKSRSLASDHGVAFRGARSEQDYRKPTCQLFCCTAVKSSLLCGSHGARQQSHIKFVWTTTMLVWTCKRVRPVCMIRVRVSRRCVCVCVWSSCWNPTCVSAFCFFFSSSACCCCCCCRIVSVSHHPSSYITNRSIPWQLRYTSSHSKFVQTINNYMYVLTAYIYACMCCVE